VAEAFHWFATRETLAGIARVLRGRGVLVIFWNIFEGQMVPRLTGEVRAAIAERLRRLAPECDYRRKVKTLAYWTRLA
jgi:hypothetical protein